MKKGKLFNKLMVVMTGVLLGLLFALNNSMSITSYAEPEEKHYPAAECAGSYTMDNETVMNDYDIGRGDSITSVTSGKITFKSSNCKANKQLKAENRNFVIEKGKTFTISISSSKRIRAVEFVGDISGNVLCDDYSYDNDVRDLSDSQQYIYFYDYDAPLSTVTFRAGAKADFEFEDIHVYYVEIETEAWITPPTTSLYLGVCETPKAA